MSEQQTQTNTLPTIAIVGRPNVGKSSLFNSILKKRQAIVHFDSGVTRDRVSSTGVANGRRFRLVDTGGLGMGKGEKRGVDFWDQSIEKQVEVAIADADVIFFVVDVTSGLTGLDEEVALRLRSTGKPVILVINKVDGDIATPHIHEFDRLGFPQVFEVSSLHRRGIPALMSEALRDFDVSAPEHTLPRLKIAVLGRPNVGKSSLVNKLLGEERVIVSDVAGTTRDSIDVEFTLNCGDEQVPALLVDTAGLRKRSKVDGAVERYSSMRAEETLKNSDIILFVIESSQTGATSQDKTIARMIVDSGKPVIIVSNKWDECTGLKMKNVLEEIRYTLPHMSFAPVVFTCAKTGYNFQELYQVIAELRAQMAIRISTAMVNRVLEDAFEKTSPQVIGTKPFKVYYGTMIANPPPTFQLFVNDPKLCPDNYKVYLEKYITKAFAFSGLPVRLEFKERKRRELVFPKVDKRKGKKNQRIRPYRVDRPEEDED